MRIQESHNSTMVRFKLEESKELIKNIVESQFHYGSIQTKNEILKEEYYE